MLYGQYSYGYEKKKILLPVTTRLSYTERNQKSMLLPKEAYIKSEFSADFKYGNGMFLKI